VTDCFENVIRIAGCSLWIKKSAELWMCLSFFMREKLFSHKR